MLPINASVTMPVVNMPSAVAFKTQVRAKIQPLIGAPSNTSNQAIPVCDFFKSMREFPSNILSSTNLSQATEVQLSETRPEPVRSQEWPHRVASSVRFIHVPEDGFGQGPQLLEYNDRFLQLSKEDRVSLQQYIDQDAALVPPLNDFEHKQQDRLVLFVEFGDALSSIKTELDTLLGAGFNDKLWSFVEENLESDQQIISQGSAVDITSIRNQAVQNSLASMVQEPILQPYFEFLDWAQTQSEKGSPLVYLNATNVEKTKGLLAFIEAGLVHEATVNSHQLPQAYAYGAAHATRDMANSIADTGHLSLINSHVLQQLHLSAEQEAVSSIAPKLTLAAHAPHWVRRADISGEIIVSDKKSHLLEVPVGAQRSEVSLELQRLLGNQLFSMEENTLLNHIDWDGAGARNNSILDISEYVDRVALAVLTNLSADVTLDAYRDLSSTVLEQCRNLNDLSFYEFSQVFLHDITNAYMQNALSDLKNSKTLERPAIVHEDQGLVRVLNLIGRNIGHKSANTVWDAELETPNQKALARHFLQLLSKQNIGVQIREIVDSSSQEALDV